ncbi:MAG TPA: 2-phosphosulfolactate phosphatase [Gemmatimonadales bacterium]|nr:2-phosphosulfolactate phosphatase [Gemmatimonadales bacterium]
MTLDVMFTPAGLAPSEVQGRVVFVIDILRAGTAMCAALAHGARAIVPVANPEEALRLAQTLGPGETVLAGERQTLRIPGFALGNSPLEMTPQAVRGRTLVMTTTNGTLALLAVAQVPRVHVAAAVNFSLVAAVAREAWLGSADLLIVCAGREGRFALDDAYTAGRLVQAATGGGRGRKGLNDAALAALDLVRRYGPRWERPLATSRGGRDLAANGMSSDIAEAARMDAYPVLAVFAERRVTAAPMVAPPAPRS